MSLDAPDEESAPEDERPEGYRSPALLRLKHPPRPTAPIRRIAQAGRQLQGDVAAARLAAIEDQITQLREQQEAFFANLSQAHAAFSRLADRIEELSEQLRQQSGA